MAKYHVNNQGEAGQCRASNGKCPFGGDAQHYETAEIARQSFELSLANQTVPVGASRAITDLPKDEAVFVSNWLMGHEPNDLPIGGMVAIENGDYALITMEDPTMDRTAPSYTSFGRGFPLLPSQGCEEALSSYRELFERGEKELAGVKETMDAPRFDSYDADAAYAARERYGILMERQHAYREIESAVRDHETVEEAATYLIKSMPPRPDGRNDSDRVQQWQAAINTVGEFAQSTQLDYVNAHWCINNMRPIEYYY